MTRKDFNALAALVKTVKDGSGACGYQWLAHRLADICAEDNPRFDWSRFITACGVSPSGVES